MNETMISYFKKKGKNLQTGSNKPFLIHDPEKIWLVVEGSVDIFSVAIARGAPAGSRNFLFDVKPGGIVMGLDAPVSNGKPGVLAVGAFGTTLIEISRKQFEKSFLDETVADAVISVTEKWISSVYEGISPDITPKLSTESQPGEEFELGARQVIRPLDDMFWVTLLKGSAAFFGEDSRISLPINVPCPLSDRAWLVTTSAKNRAITVTTSDILRQAGIGQGISLLNSLVMEMIRLNETRMKEEEKLKIEARREQERVTRESAVTDLYSVVESDTSKTIIPKGGDDPIFAAAQHVAVRIGIKLSKPPKDQAGGDGHQRLIDIARYSNFRTRKVMLRGDWWRSDCGPLAAFMAESKQPVALLPTGKSGYEIIDPVSGTRTRVTAKLSERLDPQAFSFYRPLPDKKLNGWDIYKYATSFTFRDFVLIFTMGVLGGLLGMIIPMATGQIFDSVIPGADLSQLVQLALALVVGGFAAGMFQMTRSFAMLRLETRMNSSLQGAVWDRLLKLPTPFFRDFSTGDLAVRANSINEIRAMLTGATMSTVMSSIFSVFSFFLLFYYSVKLAIVASVLILIALLVTLIASSFTVRYQRELTNIQGKISGRVLQLLNGVAKLRVAGAEMRAFSVWAKSFAKARKVSYKSVTVSNVMVTYNSVFSIISSMVIFFFILHFMKDKEFHFTTGKFLAFNAAFIQFMSATLSLSETLIGLLNIIPLYERAKPILETVPEVDLTKSNPGELMGDIEIQHLFFKYQKDGPLILKDVNLAINRGEFVAFVGPSGSGKSTVLRVLLGFEKPESGSIYLDGKDLDDLDLRLVRSQYGVVLQNGRVMGGDIFTNIVGASNLTLDDAWEAARMAGFDEDIKQMPMGMHTVLSDGGGTLSGGQRQRMMIARALIHKPRILLFDEATSALDNKTQAIVSESLDRLDATRIVIAHRLSTVMKADRIFVIVAGEVLQSGTYEELVNQPGPFYELAKRQIS